VTAVLALERTAMAMPCCALRSITSPWQLTRIGGCSGASERDIAG